MDSVQREFDVSERRACRVLEQHRSTQRYEAKEVDDFERALVKRMLELTRAQGHSRYGYRKITALLNKEGWGVNRKRIYRLWVQEGLKVPQLQRKRRRLGHSANGCCRLRPERPNHVWSYDFKFDVTDDGFRLKFLVVIDEFTRRCLAIEAGRGCAAGEVISALRRLFRLHGRPEFMRSDNGPEFVCKAVREWLEGLSIGTAYIEPGSPWENGYCESFISQFTDELLDREVFNSVLEAQVLADDYRDHYNQRRPHGSLDYQTPAEFMEQCMTGALVS